MKHAKHEDVKGEKNMHSYKWVKKFDFTSLWGCNCFYLFGIEKNNEAFHVIIFNFGIGWRLVIK